MIINEGNNSIEIEIQGYEYEPEDFIDDGDENDAESHYYDLNWLIVKITCCEGGRTETFCDPCLFSSELLSICNNFKKIRAGERRSYISNFSEPCLRIALIAHGNEYSMAVHFYQLAEDKWIEHRFSEIFNSYKLDMIIRELGEASVKFPKRKTCGNE